MELGDSIGLGTTALMNGCSFKDSDHLVSDLVTHVHHGTACKAFMTNSRSG